MVTEVRSPWNTGQRQRQSDGMSPGAFANPDGARYRGGGRADQGMPSFTPDIPPAPEPVQGQPPAPGSPESFLDRRR